MPDGIPTVNVTVPVGWDRIQSSLAGIAAQVEESCEQTRQVLSNVFQQHDWASLAKSIEQTTESTRALFASMAGSLSAFAPAGSMSPERFESLSRQLHACFDDSLVRRMAATQQMLWEISEGPDPRREKERLDRIIRSVLESIPSAPQGKRGPGPKDTLTSAEIKRIHDYRDALRGRDRAWDRIAKDKLDMASQTFRDARLRKPISEDTYRKLAKLFKFRSRPKLTRPDVRQLH